jgi:hypothetical protein
MADLSETVHSIKPTQWAMIAAAGLGVGLLLRKRSQANAAATTTVQGDGTDAGVSGTGTTGYYQGGAATPLIDPNASSGASTSPIAVSTGPAPGDIKQVKNPDGTFTTFFWDGYQWTIAQASQPATPSAPSVPSTATTNIPTPVSVAPVTPAPVIMSQADYLGSVGPNWSAFSAPGGYLDKFFANPTQVQILNPNGSMATTSQVLADLKARGKTISPSWKAIN